MAERALAEALQGFTVEDLRRMIAQPPSRVAEAVVAEAARRAGGVEMLSMMVRAYWREIEPLVTSAPRLLQLIQRVRPDLAEEIRRHPRWFNRFVAELYQRLYALAWG